MRRFLCPTNVRIRTKAPRTDVGHELLSSKKLKIKDFYVAN
jgi:hypothetical protein